MSNNAGWQQAYRDRKREAGLTEVRGIWLPPSKHKKLKQASEAIMQGLEVNFKTKKAKK